MVKRLTGDQESKAAVSRRTLLQAGAGLVGGSLFHNKPMRLVREVARRGAHDLIVVAVTQASIDVDLLVAAGCVAEVRVPYLGLEHHGLALNFKPAAPSAS